MNILRGADKHAGRVCANKRRSVRGLLALVGLLVMALPAGAAPQHVVSTYLCTDEYVFRLLPRSRIAALSYLAADTNPVVSTIADKVKGIALLPKGAPGAEDVLNRSPDLVVLYEGTNPRLRANLTAAGIAVLDVPWAQSLADIRRITLMLGDKLGAREQAAFLLAQMDGKIAQAREQALSPPVRALIYEPNGYTTQGGVSEEVMRLAGLANAGPLLRPTRAGTLPVETIIAAAPELLILSGARDEHNSRAELVQHHPALAALGGRTYIAWSSLTPLLCPGPWSLDAAATFAGLGRAARALAKAPRHP